ncbi:penicillin-binding protein 2 [Rubrimonas cliftonensis]|uniref:Peptidoglycan glycosyltransferase n=1 Tax=Rubrimonas cliftonensis TaxID=89524 RepID=A0A1H3W326_9RHOB|nr:penicillin-binding protein 2 [Rubrimonas cliftonensis]SDZ81420.1 peptidoglycan glycosyltransferase [Rubrimonas cliftonensis]
MMRLFSRSPARPSAPRKRARQDGPSVSRRVFALLGLQALAAGALALRLRQLQIEEGELYRTMAEENRINIRLLPPARGEIFDRAGRPLAVNRQNLRVVMVREQAGDVEAALDRLDRVTPIPEADRRHALREFSQKAPFVPVTVAEHLDWERFATINANAPALPGVIPEVGLTRWYPEGEVFSHVLGHVGRVSEKDREAEPDATLLSIPDFQIGKNGVEKVEEGRLRGVAGARRIEVNAGGRVIREIDREDAASGDDLRLSLDRDLQRYAMARMADESASTVVMDIATGDILCMASAPGFDPNKFVVGIGHADWNALLADDHRPLANKSVSGQYPPGSTFKMVVELAALEAGVATPGEKVFCNGGYQLGDRRFHCWRRGGHGMMDAHDALTQSCDVYYYEMARRVGVDAISAMARRLGFGERPELEQTGLAAGLTPTRAWKREVHAEGWQLGDTLNIGIGQGYMLATPLQLATMTARIASGRAVSPRLIIAEGVDARPTAEAPPLGISAANLALVREGMDSVVNSRRGTALKSRIYDEAGRMAGKTGTSQVRRITMAERARGVIRNDQLPWNRRDHALFVAYAPVSAPRYAVSVIVEHGGGGSAAAAPIARDVMLRALYGAEPPLAAYPPAEREMIERQRTPVPAAEPTPPAVETGPRRRA